MGDWAGGKVLSVGGRGLYGDGGCGMACSMQEIPTVLGFTAGELSPWLATRFDLQAYQRGAAMLKNFVTMPYGGLKRRRGSRYVADIGGVGQTSIRLFPFEFSTADTLLLVFVPGFMRLCRNRTLLPYRMETPWETAAEVDALRFTQVNDTVYCTGECIRPVRLTRRAEDDWRWEYVKPEPYPRETYAPQKDLLTVTMSTNGKTAKLALPRGASEKEFTAAMAGHEYVMAVADIPARVLFEGRPFSVPNPLELPNLADTSVTKGTVLYLHDGSTNMYKFYQCIRAYKYTDYNGSKSPAAYPNNFIHGALWLDPETKAPYEVCGGWSVRTSDTWNATWELWRSYNTTADNADFTQWDWTCLKSFTQSDYAERQNWAFSGTESVPCRMVLVCRRASALTVPPVIHFAAEKGRREYKLRITAVTDAWNAAAAVESPYLGGSLNFATHDWSFGAMGPRNGYPLFSSFFQGRIWYGGMRGLPTTLLASAVDDFDNFRVGSNDDDALHLTLSADDQSCICWLCPARQLLIGTADAEWVLGSGEGAAVTANTAAFRRQSSVGSEPMPAAAVENTVLFVQRGGRRLREISYKLESDGFTATDTSLLAEHLLRAGVQEFCVQRAGDAYVWLLMQDGSVAVLTLNPAQQVTAWQRMEFPQRRVLHLAALPDREGGDDEVWMVCYNERNNCPTLECVAGDSPYLDGATECTVSPYNPWVSLPYLAGLTVQYAAAGGSGVPVRTGTVSELGELEIEGVTKSTRISVGIAYDSALQTMPLEGLNSFNSVRQFSRVRVRLLESDPHFRYKSTCNEQWETYSGSAVQAAYPYSGSLRVVQMPQGDVGQGFTLLYNGLQNFQLLSLTVEADFHGK